MQANERNTVKRTLNLNQQPTITDAQKARLDAVALMPDEQIDYSAAPSLPDAVWMKAVRLLNNKQQVTLRIDAEVLDFFKRTGKRYQSRINAVLRAYVEVHKTHASSK